MIDSHYHQDEFILTEHIDENVESLPVKIITVNLCWVAKISSEGSLPILFTFNETMKL